MSLPYIYRWDRQGRKGQPCDVTARGTMNSCLVVFEDGFAMVASRNAIRKNKTLKSALAPATVADTAAAPGLTDPPVAAAVSGDGEYPA